LGPNDSRIQWVLTPLTLEARHAGRETQSSIDVMNEWSYKSTLPYALKP